MPEPGGPGAGHPAHRLVALVVSESEDRVFDEPFFAGIIRGIGSALPETRAAALPGDGPVAAGARAGRAPPDRAARRRRAAALAARRRPAAGAAGGDGRADRARRRARSAARPPVQLRRRGQRGPAPGRRSSTCSARAAAGSPPSPARRTWAWAWTGSPATATRCWPPACAEHRRRTATSARRAARRRCASCSPRPRPRRGVRRLRPDGAGRDAGAARGGPARSPTTSRWSASTTRLPARTPTRR